MKYCLPSSVLTELCLMFRHLHRWRKHIKTFYYLWIKWNIVFPPLYLMSFVLCSGSCSVRGKTYKVGEKFIDQKICGSCHCTESGGPLCMPLCVPMGVVCRSDQVKKYKMVKRSPKCSCKVPYCEKMGKSLVILLGLGAGMRFFEKTGHDILWKL